MTGAMPQFNVGEDTKEARAYRSEHRRDPLPPNTWVVVRDDKFSVLRVLGPGVAELFDGTGQPTRVDVASVKVGWWRRWRLRIADPAGATITLGVVPFGDAGIADAGRPKSDSGSFWASLGDDPISMVIFLVAILLFFVTGPIWWIRRRRRIRTAKEIRAALQR